MRHDLRSSFSLKRNQKLGESVLTVAKSGDKFIVVGAQCCSGEDLDLRNAI